MTTQNPYWTDSRLQAVKIGAAQVAVGTLAILWASNPVGLLSSAIYTIGILGVTNGGLKLGLDIGLPEESRQQVDAGWAWTSPVGRYGGAATAMFGMNEESSLRWAGRTQLFFDVALGAKELWTSRTFLDAASMSLTMNQGMQEVRNSFPESSGSSLLGEKPATALGNGLHLLPTSPGSESPSKFGEDFSFPSSQ